MWYHNACWWDCCDLVVRLVYQVPGCMFTSMVYFMVIPLGFSPHDCLTNKPFFKTCTYYSMKMTLQSLMLVLLFALSTSRKGKGKSSTRSKTVPPAVRFSLRSTLSILIWKPCPSTRTNFWINSVFTHAVVMVHMEVKDLSQILTRLAQTPHPHLYPAPSPMLLHPPLPSLSL